MYTAAVLDEPSVEQLRQEVLGLHLTGGFRFRTERGSPLPHHVTINLGDFDSKLNPRDVLGKTCEVIVDAIHFDLSVGICAARVIELKTQHSVKIQTSNKHPHITCCLLPPNKPVLSNKLFTGEWKSTTIVELSKRLQLKATIMEVAQ